MKRSSRRERRTHETEIALTLDLDGQGRAEIATGIGFLDHMLTLFAHHGRFDLDVKARGDLHVDFHHTVEDVGLTLGDALAEALADKAGIGRFGVSYVPLDEALSRAVVDLSGRPYLHYRVLFQTERVGDFPVELFEDFFRAVSDRARLTLHLETLYGRNSHHVSETLFKAFARALRDAVAVGPPGIPSTKGTLTA